MEDRIIQGDGSNDALVVAHTMDAADADNQVPLATAIIKILPTKICTAGHY